MKQCGINGEAAYANELSTSDGWAVTSWSGWQRHGVLAPLVHIVQLVDELEQRVYCNANQRNVQGFGRQFDFFLLYFCFVLV